MIIHQVITYRDCGTRSHFHELTLKINDNTIKLSTYGKQVYKRNCK